MQTLSLPTVSTKLTQIAEQSKQNPTMVFTTLAYLMDEEFLKEAFHRIRRDAAAGVDQIIIDKIISIRISLYKIDRWRH